MLSDDAGMAPIILPMVRGSDVIGWYAATRGFDGAYELGAEINAWFGPAYLSVFAKGRSERRRSASGRHALAVRRRHLSFLGSRSRRAIAFIGERLAEYAALLKRRPATQRRTIRPVGSIRADFERALLAQDAAEARGLHRRTP